MLARLATNILAVAGTLALTYAPIVYMAHTLQAMPGVAA